MRISFDGRDVTPAFSYFQDSSIQQPADPMTPAVATVRLSGLSPAHARTFVWRYDLTSASYTLTVHTAGGERATTVWLESDQNSQPFALDDPVAPSRGRIAATYFALGFTHIVPHGPDHILFVLGIFLLNRRLRPILWQVSAFTIAHSITLGLDVRRGVAAPATVEPLIALSIVYVAVENLVTSELQPWRIGLVFAFGLLHGMGFAARSGSSACPAPSS